MATPLRVVVPLRLPSTNDLLRQERRHRARVARRHRRLAMMILTRTAAPFARAMAAGRRITITLVRIGPGTLDDDNLSGACKAVRDGVADALGIDDDDPRVRWRYAQRKSRARPIGIPPEYGCEITLCEEGDIE